MPKLSPITQTMLTILKTEYPKAVRYCDLYRQALPNTSMIDQIDRNGGGRLKCLVKRGVVKTVVEGYYVWVPQ